MASSEALTAPRRLSLLVVASLLLLGCAALTLVLRAVPKTELGTVTAAVLYTLAANTLQSPTKTSSGRIGRLALSEQLSKTTVRIFLFASLLLSLLLPWAWIVVADDEEIKLLGPHLFLMMAQVLFEIWSYRACVSVVVRIGIPVGFVSYRMRLLVDWVVVSLRQSGRAMVALAGANLAFWGFVLFYVLLLKVCPPYFLEGRKTVQDAPTRSPACSLLSEPVQSL